MIASLTVLLVAVSAAAFVANDQRSKAVTQARIATARQVAAESETLLTTNLDVAQLLAVKAYQTDQDPQTLTALFKAVTASPALVRYLPAGDQVSAIAGSADGRVAVAGTSGGGVLRWDLVAGTRARLALLRQPINAVASNDNGTVIAAASRSQVAIWTSGRRPEMLRVPSGVDAGLIAVSPTGRFVAISFNSLTADATSKVVLVDRQTGQVSQTGLDSPPTFLAIPTEATLIVVKNAGAWERFSMPGLSPTLVSVGPGEGVHVFASAISANGAFFTYSNGASLIDLWSTARPQNSPDQPPDLVALSHGSAPEALAVSADGQHVAVADAGTIYVGGTGSTAPGPAPQVVLSGTSSTSAIAFLGDGSRLLSASGDSLVFWDLSQLNRIGTHTSLSVPSGCNACLPPAVEVRPDGRQAVVIGDITPGAPPLGGGHLTIRGLGPDPDQTVISGDQDGVLGWNAGASRLFLALSDGSVETRATGQGTAAPVVGRWPAFARGQIPIAVSPDGRRVVTLDHSGQVRVYDPVTRRLDRAVPGVVKNEDVQAAVSATGAFVAETLSRPDGTTSLRLIDTRTGTVRMVGSSDVAIATFSGQHLLVLYGSGRLEVRNLAGITVQRSIREDRSYVSGVSGVPTAPVIAGSLLVQQRSDGTLVITDLATGDSLGSLTLPAGYTGLRTGFAATPDGRQLIGATETSTADYRDGQFVEWHLSVGAWIRTACTSAGRNLTAAEWRRYAGTTPGNLACSG